MINPRVDFAFKRIFETHQDLLISLINAVVSKDDQVKSIEIRNPFIKLQHTRRTQLPQCISYSKQKKQEEIYRYV